MTAPGAGRFVRIAENVDRCIQGIDSLPADLRKTVIEECVKDLSQRADHFAAKHPLGHEPHFFVYEFALLHDGVLHSFDFCASSEHFEMGVVDVVYVSHESIDLR
jgi:hypothetical protein